MASRGLSSYLRGLAFALRPHNVHVTNVRFGFVDTKMATSPTKPMLISADKAADLLLHVYERGPSSSPIPSGWRW